MAPDSVVCAKTKWTTASLSRDQKTLEVLSYSLFQNPYILGPHAWGESSNSRPFKAVEPNYHQLRQTSAVSVSPNPLMTPFFQVIFKGAKEDPDGGIKLRAGDKAPVFLFCFQFMVLGPTPSRCLGHSQKLPVFWVIWRLVIICLHLGSINSLFLFCFKHCNMVLESASGQNLCKETKILLLTGMGVSLSLSVSPYNPCCGDCPPIAWKPQNPLKVPIAVPLSEGHST